MQNGLVKFARSAECNYPKLSNSEETEFVSNRCFLLKTHFIITDKYNIGLKMLMSLQNRNVKIAHKSVVMNLKNSNSDRCYNHSCHVWN